MTESEKMAACLWDSCHGRRVEVHNAMVDTFALNLVHVTALNYLQELAVEEGKYLAALEAAGVTQGEAIEYAAARRREEGEI